MNNIDEVKDSLASKSLNVCVIGIGRIGLPTALSFANVGLQTIGVDINEKLVDSINAGNFPLKDEPGYEEIFDKVRKNGNFSTTIDINEAIPKSNLILLSLPTPMDEKNIPNYSALESVGKQLSHILQPNSLVIVESTIEPGFIENDLINILEKAGRLHAEKNFTIGVCPENANPGEILHDFTNLPRLIAGINNDVTKIIQMIYNFVFPVELVEMPDCKTANVVKLTTNVFRDINIAFISELSLMFEKLGIDTNKVLEAAKKKYNFQVHYPGAGVGGPCLPINSYQLLNTARRTGVKLGIIESGRKVNEKMPDHVIDLISDAFRESNIRLDGSDILIFGVSYKPNVKDIQLTPAEHIIEKLKNLGANVHIYDPYFTSTKIFGIDTLTTIPDENILKTMNAAVIVTGHDSFKSFKISNFSLMKNPILVDTRGIFEPRDAKNANLIFRGLGRGD